MRSVTITQARRELCPLVEQVESLPGRKVGITVSGAVAAYLVAAEEMDALEAKARRGIHSARPSFRGSLEIVGDLSCPGRIPSDELEHMALEAWRGRDG